MKMEVDEGFAAKEKRRQEYWKVCQKNSEGYENRCILCM
jgi:hypothetical protein